MDSTGVRTFHREVLMVLVFYNTLINHNISFWPSFKFSHPLSHRAWHTFLWEFGYNTVESHHTVLQANWSFILTINPEPSLVCQHSPTSKHPLWLRDSFKDQSIDPVPILCSKNCLVRGLDICCNSSHHSPLPKIHKSSGICNSLRQQEIHKLASIISSQD